MSSRASHLAENYIVIMPCNPRSVTINCRYTSCYWVGCKVNITAVNCTSPNASGCYNLIIIRTTLLNVSLWVIAIYNITTGNFCYHASGLDC